MLPAVVCTEVVEVVVLCSQQVVVKVVVKVVVEVVVEVRTHWHTRPQRSV
jgi:hypothetical protein